MAKPLTKKELSAMECSDCGGDDHVYMHSQCHPKSPTWVNYSEGYLTIECAECDKVITVIKVAED